jgi:hypothetical protein
MQMKGTYFGRNGAAFDAASGAGLAFLSSQLAIPHTELIKPLESTVYPYVIPIKTGGGFPEYIEAWASNYQDSEDNLYGFTSNQNEDVPLVQFDVQQAAYRVNIFQKGMFVSYIDLDKLYTAKQRGLTPPFSLDQQLRDGVALSWHKTIDRTVFLGDGLTPGLCNNPNVPASTVANTGTGSSTLWANKTSFQIFNDVQSVILTAIANSGYTIGKSNLSNMDGEGVPNTILIPFSRMQYLAQPMGIQPVAYITVKEYIEKYSIPTTLGMGLKVKVQAVPDPWIATQGVGGTARMVAYRNDEHAVQLRIPQPLMQRAIIPTPKRGGGYIALYNGSVSQVMWFRETTAAYGDGI